MLENRPKQEDVSVYSRKRSELSLLLWQLWLCVPAADEWFMAWELDQGVIPVPFVAKQKPLLILIRGKRWQREQLSSESLQLLDEIMKPLT